ncbi:protein-disulfide reductase DsbD [Pseudorhodoferax soli]|uniref:Thiol:disulfide interchange protein DsbD n=1 Tax=Pseudorhodoferax soli TaxID=545864 RepID=A0A368XKV6_9BURK|nr:protein-disulfide reductase DsbD [Pseudorhodoferax soli]RCW68540.1 thiol:disulfide interchange protein DsbD [Pseudorhodoferax soli]
MPDLFRPARVLWLFFMVLMVAMATGTARGEVNFLPADKAFALQIDQSTGTTVRLSWTIAPGYYLYRDRIEAMTDSGATVVLPLPPGQLKDDPNFGEVQVFHQAVSTEAKSSGARELTITWQGCAEAGLCYPPQSRTLPVQGGAASELVAPPGAPPTNVADPAQATDSDYGISQILASRSLVWTIPLFLVLGIGLAFTPCVLPMLPIVSGMVVGSHATQRRAFVLSGSYGLAMALTYAAIGVAAALAGANLQAALQNQWTIAAFTATFVLLAMSMFGFFTLQLPGSVRARLDNIGRGTRGGTVAGAAVLGLVSALFVGPCMTAPLAGTLMYIAQTGNAAQGGMLLFVLGLGMATPLVLVCTVGSRFLPKPGPWMTRVNGVFGFGLLATAIWMISRVVPASATLALAGAWMITVAFTLWPYSAGKRSPNVSRWGVLQRSGAALAGIWGLSMMLGSAAGASNMLRPLASIAGTPSAADEMPFAKVRSADGLDRQLAAAVAEGKPTMVVFSADWCTSCRTIEREVFDQSAVRSALSGWNLVTADVTEGDPDQRALMRNMQVLGPPTVLLLDARGQERRTLRLVGEFGTDTFLRRLNASESAS